MIEQEPQQNNNFDEIQPLSGMELTLAMSAWTKAKEKAIGDGILFAIPRPNSKAHLEQRRKEHQAILQAKLDKGETKMKEDEEKERKKKVSHRPEPLPEPQVVEIFEEHKKEKKHVQSIFEDEKLFLSMKEKLSPVYSHRPRLETFIGAEKNSSHAHEYTKEQIEEDLRYVEMSRSWIQVKNEHYGESILNRTEVGFRDGEILQAMIIDRINNGWLPNMKGIMTSDFDDLKVGIDCAFKYKNETYFGASFDMTISEDDEVIEHKIQKNWNRFILTGRIPTLKYFEDPDNENIKGRRSMPKFVIGGSRGDLEALTKAYLEDDLESIAHHPLQYSIIAQIDAQLSKIIQFSFSEENINNKKFDYAREQYSHFNEVFQEIKKSVGYEEKIKDEKIFAHIQSNKIYQVSKNYDPKNEIDIIEEK